MKKITLTFNHKERNAFNAILFDGKPLLKDADLSNKVVDSAIAYLKKKSKKEPPAEYCRRIMKDKKMTLTEKMAFIYCLGFVKVQTDKEFAVMLSARLLLSSQKEDITVLTQVIESHFKAKAESNSSDDKNEDVTYTINLAGAYHYLLQNPKTTAGLLKLTGIDIDITPLKMKKG
jgi:hypothetical protein